VRFSLAELAARFGLTVHGNSAHEIQGVATLSGAGTSELSFFANTKYRAQLHSSQAGAVLLQASQLAQFSGNALVSRNPHADFARIATLFAPPQRAVAGIHPSAQIDAGAQVHPSAEIGAMCVVANSAVIAQGAILGAFSYVGPGCTVGAYSELMPRATLVKRVQLGRCVIVHSGAVLGADGFSFAKDGGTWLKVPQLGGVIVGDGCDIGANSTIDCGALEDTVLGCEVKLDNQIQIGHNVHIGDHTAIAGATAVAGSAKIGARCMIAGGVGIAGHLSICDDVTILAMSLVATDITEAGVYAGSMPLMEQREWRKNAVHIRRLDATRRGQSS
jgi:UDP-3-O-[3-hydroxymyristoyl] glucosamine N-acyltransferase